MAQFRWINFFFRRNLRMFLYTSHFSPVSCTAKSANSWKFFKGAANAPWAGMARLFTLLLCLTLLVLTLKSALELSKASTVQEPVAVMKISECSMANGVAASSAAEVVSLKNSPFCSACLLVSFDADLNDRDILVTTYGILSIARAAAYSEQRSQPLDHNHAPQLRPPRQTA